MTAVRSEAHVATPRSARYLGQLCKHFAHRVPATYGDGKGRVEFPAGLGRAYQFGEPVTAFADIVAHRPGDVLVAAGGDAPPIQL